MNNDIFNKFSPNLKKTLLAAEHIAKERNVGVDTEHQLLSLLQEKDTLAFDILSSFNITADRLELIAALVGQNVTDKESFLGLDAKKSIQQAVHFAAKYNHLVVGSEHLLLALVSNQNFHSYLIIERAGIDPKKIKRQIESIFRGINNTVNQEPGFRPGQPFEIGPEAMMGDMDSQGFGDGPMMPFGQTATGTKKESALESFSTNLTRAAADGKLDPVIGREKEISRLIQTLSRRMKNNPILVGEPGVGKTAIVEGLAQRISAGTVPAKIVGTEIMSIDLGSILAGTMYRGQFESRIKKILAEIEKRGNIILFVDEIHMMVGAGSTEGSIDAANLLKPMLAKGTLRLIGSTTFDEYKKHIEKDPAFERRFQPIYVTEPTLEETIKILCGIKGRYEKFHRVSYSPEAIAAAATLSSRYIHDRQLPDKAIDLIDEAGAAHNSKIVSSNPLSRLEKDLRGIVRKKEAHIKAEEYAKAAAFKESELKLIAQMNKLKLKNKPETKMVITDDDIAGLVAEWTGVPVSNLNAKEKQNYQNLDKRLKKFIIGQDDAIDELAKAIKRARVGISNPKRPIGSFIFLGPTGVGKTESAKVLAREIFGSEDSLLRIDMSEFMEKHNVARLIGAPAGYIGYDEGGKLTEKIRKNPFTIILFDEIEKAHPDVFNILLQIMEDGELTDAKGRKVNFKNTIIIMTSNLGTDVLRRQISIGFNKASTTGEKYNLLRDNVLETVEKTFRPEFLNRLDKIIVFYPLGDKSLRRIVDLQCLELIKRLAEKGIKIEIGKDVRDFIAVESYTPEFGARPIRKYLADHIETLLSDAILDDRFAASATIKVALKNKKITLE